MADPKAKIPNGNASVKPDSIPNGTGPKNESHLLEALRACNARNFDTLADVALSGVKGEPLDDKTYLMERIIQLTADLPLHDKLSDTLTNNFLSQLWDDLSHPPQSYLGYEYAFRRPDGSNNNILWPHVGSSGQPYARSVRAKKMQPARPDPEVIFDSVLARKEFVPHPNKISSVLFYVASIIIHDCFHTSHEDYAISETSSYLDLAPLYGSTLEQQLKMRTMQDGKLKPDCFSDSRILGFPPGVGVLLIMFNRFHNHVVENLAKIDENGRFSSIKKGLKRTSLTPRNRKGEPELKTSEELYDEALFQTGRLITTGLYVNIVLQDYVRTILGLNRVDSLWNLDPRADSGKAVFGHKIPEAQGNQVSAEFSLVYRWHSCISERDAKWTEDALNMIKKMAKLDENATSTDAIKAAMTMFDGIGNQDPQNRRFDTLQREPDGRYSDDDLCRIWVEGVEDVAGAFGAAHVPPILKYVEILGINQARSWNLASLNEFREYFKLQPHKTFESINPDPRIAKQLERLYGHPDNVEIYPGIVVESAKKPMAPGSGLCASWTTSRAILSDAVSLVRSDRFHTVDYTPNNLTNWGFKTSSYDLDINHGGLIYKLVLNAFPNHISKNSVYAHFPLVVPGENKKLLQGMNRAGLYNFDQPQTRPAPLSVKASTELGAQALTDSSNFTSLWTNRSAAFGAPEVTTKPIKANPKMSFAEAVLSNEKWKTVATKYYTSTLEKLWQDQQYELGGYQTIDVVADVLNVAHTGFITSVLGIPLTPSSDKKKEEPHGLLSIIGHIFDSAFSTNPQPAGLSGTVRGITQWYAGRIEAGLHGNGANAGSKEEQLGQAAFEKLNKTNGPGAKEAVWRDILPTSALMLTALCRSSATAVESAVPERTTSVATPAAPSAGLSLAVRAKRDTEAVETGQVVIVKLPVTGTANTEISPDVNLAMKVAEVCNTVLKGIINKGRGIERVPGPQGQIKKASFGAEVKYLNKEESEYVPYPVSMKLRWKK